MEGIETLIRRIDDEAQREIDAIFRDADARAQTLAADYDRLAQQVRQDILADAARGADALTQRLSGHAAQQARLARLRTQQSLLDTLFSRALARLRALPEEEAASFLAQVAARSSWRGDEEVILSGSDRARLGEPLVREANRALACLGRPAGLTLSEQTRPSGGGFFLKRGDVEMNCTFPQLLRTLREDESAAAARWLFHGEDTP